MAHAAQLGPGLTGAVAAEAHAASAATASASALAFAIASLPAFRRGSGALTRFRLLPAANATLPPASAVPLAFTWLCGLPVVVCFSAAVDLAAT